MLLGGSIITPRAVRRWRTPVTRTQRVVRALRAPCSEDGARLTAGVPRAVAAMAIRSVAVRRLAQPLVESTRCRCSRARADGEPIDGSRGDLYAAVPDGL
jgi:hypothetical protein